MCRRKENPPHCASQEISQITHRLPKPPHTKREAKKFITVKIRGRDGNGRPSILGEDQIEIPAQFRLMASDVLEDTRKLIFSLCKYYKLYFFW